MKNKNNKINIKQFLKPIFLILISIILYVIPNFIFPTYNLGILPVDNINKDELITINYTFSNQNKNNPYSKYFNSQILVNENLNSNYIKQEKGFLLNDDFFKYEKLNQIKNEYNLDFVIISTNEQIKDWNKKGFGIWGQADTKTESVLMTTVYFKDNSKKIPSIAQHEIFHLFGYLHNPINQNGIMQYKNLDETKLSRYYEHQLPIRIFVKQFITNKNFTINYFLINFILVLALYPMFLGLNQILNKILKIIKKNKNNKNNKINHISTSLGIFILFCMNLGYLVFFASLFLSLSTNYFLNFRK